MYDLKHELITNRFQFNFIHFYFFIVYYMIAKFNDFLKKNTFRRFNIIIIFTKNFYYEFYMFIMLFVVFKIN